MENAKTICFYSSVYDLISENTTRKEEEALSAIFETREDYEDFLSSDDFENYGYFLLDFKRVIVTHDCDVISTFDSLEDMIKKSAEEFKKWREN